MGKKRKKRRSGKRRKERKERQDQESLGETRGSRSRRLSDFSGKSRNGDQAELKLQFSGIPVPVEDKGDPGKNLLEQTELARRNQGQA